MEVKDGTVTVFGCCAFWKVCNLGTSTCVYSEKNPAKQNACGAYRRAMTNKYVSTTVQAKEEVHTSPISIEKENELFDLSEDGQLTLF